MAAKAKVKVTAAMRRRARKHAQLKKKYERLLKKSAKFKAQADAVRKKMG